MPKMSPDSATTILGKVAAWREAWPQPISGPRLRNPGLRAPPSAIRQLALLLRAPSLNPVRRLPWAQAGTGGRRDPGKGRRVAGKAES